LTAGLSVKHALSRRWKYRLGANWYNRQEQTTSPGVALDTAAADLAIPPFSSDNNFDRGQLGATTIFSPTGGLKLSFGAGARFEQGANNSTLAGLPFRFDLERYLYGYFTEARYTTAWGLCMQAGVRVDDPEGFDTEISTRIGVLYPLNEGTTVVKANWGEGFKLSSFFALGNPIVGNPSLQPESSRGLDLGVEQSFAGGYARVGITGFYNRYRNLIDSPPPTFRLINRSEVTTPGVELGLSLQPANTVLIDSNVTYTKTDIRGTSDELRNRPEWRAGITTTWEPRSNLLLSLTALHLGEVFNSSIPTGDMTLDDYQRVDLSGAWSLRSGLRIGFAINNLFEADYQEFVGFPAPGTRLRLSAGVDF
jgi:vitamin B12 transporter